MANYDSTFFDYVNSGSIVSAKMLLPVVLQNLSVHSVLDVGCGQGAWLSIWRELGIEDLIGVDGDYVDRRRLLIPEASFQAIDLKQGFSLGRRFDLVQSLEVAEHLPSEAADPFVECLCAHGDLILFSAAPPGQGGDNHINERPYDYWRLLFAKRGYFPHDFVRPLVADLHQIEPWYRFNTFLYASETITKQLSESVRQTMVPNTTKLKDLSPLTYRFRKLIIRALPVSVVTELAKVKERRVIRTRTNHNNGA